jgi:hypothetical protein
LEISEIKRLKLSKDDLLLVTITNDKCKENMGELKALFPDNKILVMAQGCSIKQLDDKALAKLGLQHIPEKNDKQMKIFTCICKISVLALVLLGMGETMIKDINGAILYWCGASIVEGFAIEAKIKEKENK